MISSRCMFFEETLQEDKETDRDLQTLGFNFNHLRVDEFDIDDDTLKLRRERSRTERMANKTISTESMLLKREISRQSIDMTDMISHTIPCELVKRHSIIVTAERCNEQQPKDDEAMSGTTAESTLPEVSFAQKELVNIVMRM